MKTREEMSREENRRELKRDRKSFLFRLEGSECSDDSVVGGAHEWTTHTPNINNYSTEESEIARRHENASF